MPNVLFSQYQNELARVLGTCQHSSKVVSSKSVSVSAAEAKSEEEEQPVSKSQHKQEKRISAQSSQIKDLRTKLDGAIVENAQIWELLNPATLQASQFRPYKSGGKFLGKKQEPVIAAGKDGMTDPDKTCNYCKDMGHDVDNCLHLQKRKAFLACQSQSGGGLN